MHQQPQHQQLDLVALNQLLSYFGTEDAPRAAELATQMLAGAGLTWTALIEATGRGMAARQFDQSRQPQPRPRQPANAKPPQSAARSITRHGHTVTEWRDQIQRGNSGRVTEWEWQFLASVVAPGGLTAKQWSVLMQIAGKAGVSAGCW
jgi:hypothetical protein